MTKNNPETVFMTATDKQSISPDRFIPFQKQDIIDQCTRQQLLSDEQCRDFAQLCHILESLFHF
ncbi:MAG: hypothetical protein ACI9FJ_003281 [Alteromonadaceae bacterium]|jgi:hypothetical protein